MRLNHKNRIESVLHRTVLDMNPFENIDSKFNKRKITEFIRPIHQTNTKIFEITNEVVSSFGLEFDGFEDIQIQTNQYEFFEFIYGVVESTVELYIKPKINEIEEINFLNDNTIKLFFQPNNVTIEELEWVESIMKTSSETKTIKLKLDEHNQFFYLINLKRLLDSNRDNPNFNDSILEFLKK